MIPCGLQEFDDHTAPAGYMPQKNAVGHANWRFAAKLFD
jgi:hypothetical protein